jgi:hypothetical protein
MGTWNLIGTGRTQTDEENSNNIGKRNSKKGLGEGDLFGGQSNGESELGYKNQGTKSLEI